MRHSETDPRDVEPMTAGSTVGDRRSDEATPDGTASTPREALGERLAKLSAHVPGMMYQFAIDREGAMSFAYASDRIVTFFGVTPENAARDARTALSAVHEDDVTRLVDAIRDSRRTGGAWEHEFRATGQDGRLRWLRGTANPEHLADGSTMWHGFIEDVTEQRRIADRLRTQEATLRQVTDTVHDVLSMTDAEGRIEFVTPSVRTVLGVHPRAVIGRSIVELFHPADRHVVTAALQRRHDRPSDGSTFEVRAVHADGREVWLEGNLRPIDVTTGAVIAFRDATPRITARQALQRELTVRRSIVELTNEMLSRELDDDHYAGLLRRAVALVPGAEAGSVIVRDEQDQPFRFVAADGFDLDALLPIRVTLEELRRSDPPVVEKLFVRRDVSNFSDETQTRIRQAGRLDELTVTLSIPIDVGGVAYGFLNLDAFAPDDPFDDESLDVGEALAAQLGVAMQRRLLERRLREEHDRYLHLSGHDPLTGIPNRRTFQERLEAASRRATDDDSRCALVYVDLDEFKSVNDRYGHAVGDDLLIQVAHRIAGTVRADDLAARLGGDEFAVVLSRLRRPEDVLVVSTKIESSLARPFDLVGGIRLTIGASLGAAVQPDDGAGVDGLMHAADEAMYERKRERQSAPTQPTRDAPLN